LKGASNFCAKGWSSLRTTANKKDSRRHRHLRLIWKALTYRVIAIAFTALFTGISKSLQIHIGLTLIYYLFDVIWDRPHRR
jgi:hypothetical protein